MSQRRYQEVAYPIEAGNTEERINASKGMQHKRIRVFDNYNTTATYADSLIFDKRLIKSVVITIIEKGGAQSIFYKLLACIDPSDWHEIVGATALAASAHTAITISDAWAYLKLQAINNSGSGKIDAFMSGQTP
jgi:hypothetical protein